MSMKLTTPAVMAFQFKTLYRYGQMSVCGNKLDDFKFCMSLKSMHPEEKRDAWIRRRAEWWANRRLTKSSEDVCLGYANVSSGVFSLTTTVS
jgi:hypothetical protein